MKNLNTMIVAATMLATPAMAAPPSPPTEEQRQAVEDVTLAMAAALRCQNLKEDPAMIAYGLYATGLTDDDARNVAPSGKMSVLMSVANSKINRSGILNDLSSFCPWAEEKFGPNGKGFLMQKEGK